MNKYFKGSKMLFVSTHSYHAMIRPSLYSLKLMQVGRVLGQCCYRVVLVMKSLNVHL